MVALDSVDVDNGGNLAWLRDQPVYGNVLVRDGLVGPRDSLVVRVPVTSSCLSCVQCSLGE